MIIGSHLLLARDGAAATNGAIDGAGGAAVVVAYNLKPDTSMPANWMDIGSIEDCNIDPKATEDEIMAPTPGAYRRVDILTSMAKLDLSFTVQDTSELFFEMLMQAGGGPIEADYAPMTATGRVKGWWKTQQYDQGDAVRNVFDVWAICNVKATKMDNKRIKAQFEVKALFNALNTGVLSLA
jgi:hypothetical protein